MHRQCLVRFNYIKNDLKNYIILVPMNAEIVLGWDKIKASSTVSAYGNNYHLN